MSSIIIFHFAVTLTTIMDAWIIFLRHCPVKIRTPRLVEVGIISPPMKYRAVQRDLLPLTEQHRRSKHYNVLHKRGGMHMQTQSMNVTLIYEDASALDYRPSIFNQLRNWDWSQTIWDLCNEE